jgi:hypothetical protein
VVNLALFLGMALSLLHLGRRHEALLAHYSSRASVRRDYATGGINAMGHSSAM